MAFSGGTFSRTFDCTTDRDNGVKILASKFDTELDGMATGLSTCILKDGTQTCTAAIPFAQGITLPDDKTIAFGTNSDVLIQYDETTTDSLKISAAEGAGLAITLMADEGDDAGDEWKLNIADGGTLTLGNDINSAGTYVTHLTITPNATVANSTMAVAGNLTVGGALTLGSGAVISEAELETIDGITPGTVLASKAMIVDANKDITGGRNLTITGELDAATLDISGNADIDGTLEADAMTLNGSAITTVATLSTGISNGNLPVFTSGAADNDFLRIDGTAIEGRSAAEVLSDIGAQASLTFGISNTNAIKIDSSSVADDEYARFTANGLESRATAEVLSDIAAAPAAGSSNIVTTGALNSGSITSGFGAIDNGSNAITTTGTITGGSVAVDNITIDGTEIDLSSGDLTLDVAGDINLDADGGEVNFQDGGTTVAYFSNSSSDLLIGVNTSDKDLYIQGNDGGSTINALHLDMSAAGLATFNAGANFNGNVGIGTASPTKKVSASIGLNDTDGYVLEYSGDAKGGILLNPAGGEVRMGAINSSGTYFPTFYSNNSEAMRLSSSGTLSVGLTDASPYTGTEGFIVALNDGAKFGALFGCDNIANREAVKFVNPNGEVGSINTNGSATSYNTSSDYRLKTGVTYDWDATSRLKQLKPARFKWIVDGDDAVSVDGFLAHEVESIVPESISGSGKDAMKDEAYEVSPAEVDDDGNVTKEAVMGTRSVPDLQGIDQSKLVPLLCKTILELEARITALEAG